MDRHRLIRHAHTKCVMLRAFRRARAVRDRGPECRAALLAIASLVWACHRHPAPSAAPTVRYGSSSENAARGLGSVGSVASLLGDLPPAITPISADPNAALGTNLSEFRDWSAEWSMIDAFKQSRPWISGTAQAWQTEEPLDLDARGWVRSLRPGQVARTLLFWGGQPYPEGDYVVLYDGEGELEYFQNTDLRAHAAGRDVLHLDPRKGGLGIFLTHTNPSNYLRNIRVISPGGACSQDVSQVCEYDDECAPGRCLSFERHHEQLVFHPIFLRALRPYRVVRFMNWMATNDSQQEHFEERPLPEDARWTLRGVPLELMVQLANRLQLDPWFCMPHKATDTYVRRFAAHVRDHLDPSLRAYVEHSNEVWNGIFAQHAYAAERAATVSGARDDDQFARQMRWHAQRSKHIFALWGDVYGGDRARFIRTLGSWADVPYISELLLAEFAPEERPDALAIAPYFGHDPPEANTSLDRVFATYLPRQLELARQRMHESQQVARRYGVALIAYESGQHLVAADPQASEAPLEAMLDAINRDPRMKEVYEHYFDAWRAAGGQLLVHYVNVEGYGPYGRWGAREHMLQGDAEAPKWSAILSWSRRNPRWW